MQRFSVDALLKVTQVGYYFGGPLSFAPDGKAVAIVIQRGKATVRHHQRDYLWDNDRADVWLAKPDGGPATLITDGARDGSGFWAPQWSPDGAHLAMLSTRGDNVTLWVWERASGALRQLSTHGLALADPLALPFAWMSPTRLLCLLLPPGEQPWLMTLETQAAETAMEAWPQAWRGEGVTASVLESGAPFDPATRSQRYLALFDVESGATRVLANGPITSFAPAPDGQRIAYTLLVDCAPLDDRVPLARDFFVTRRFAVHVVDVATGSDVELHGAGRDVQWNSLRWSPDGASLALLRFRPGRASLEPVIADPTTGAAIALAPTLDAQAAVPSHPFLSWAADGALLVHATLLDARGYPTPDARRDWWLVAPGEERCLTERFAAPPDALLALLDRRSFAGLADGALWRFSLEGETVRLLDDALRLSRIVWPQDVLAWGMQALPVDRMTFTHIVAQQAADGEPQLHRIDLAAGQHTRLLVPASGVQLLGYDSQRRLGVYTRSDNNGLALWVQPDDGEATQVLEANQFLAAITPGVGRTLAYRSLDGEPLHATLLLPPGYEDGQRVPLVAWVYPGLVYGPASTPDGFTMANALNMQLLAARGYAVLSPSIPLHPRDGRDDVLLRLLNGVMPAVEQVVAAGYADPQRLYLMGHSFGGYATYGLLTKTTRFAAAIALAGISNLVSYYGTLDPRQRYDTFAHEDLSPQSLLETSLHLQAPPWRDAGRYWRNSPLAFVDRVETPLLIIQGDLDYVPITQGEEFFMALHRRGKRAAFVRYWGEGHVLQSPANMRDLWERITAWFDAFVGG